MKISVGIKSQPTSKADFLRWRTQAWSPLLRQTLTRVFDQALLHGLNGFSTIHLTAFRNVKEQSCTQEGPNNTSTAQADEEIFGPFDPPA